MKNVLAAVLFLSSFSLEAAEPPRRWIVELTEPIDTLALRSDVSALRQRGAVLPLSHDQVEARLPRLDMMVVVLTEEDALRLGSHPSVRSVEPDRPVHAFASTGKFEPAAGAEVIPWGVSLVRADKVWPITRGEGVRVAVIDSGIDLDHPELAPVYAGGYDFLQNDEIPQDENGHGSHVAGTIAAAQNGEGIVGVAPGVEIYALRVLDGEGNGTTSGVVRAVDWAIANGIHVINLSLGSSISSLSERSAFERAEQAGIIAVAATGNSHPIPGLSYPAGYRTVLSVGAVDRELMIGSFSQRGTGMDIVAPGVGVDSTVPRSISPDVRIEMEGTAPLVRSLLEYSPLIPESKPLSGVLHYANRGLTDADFAGAAGKVSLIERGDAFFYEKVRRARANGAIAAIIFNNSSDDNDLAWTLSEPSTAHVPAIGITQSEGMALRSRAGQTVQLSFSPRLFGLNTGTSMASPHVAGVVALMRALHPGATPQQLRRLTLDAAADLGDSGYDLTHGWGLADAEHASVLDPVRRPRRGVRR